MPLGGSSGREEGAQGNDRRRCGCLLTKHNPGNSKQPGCSSREGVVCAYVPHCAVVPGHQVDGPPGGLGVGPARGEVSDFSLGFRPRVLAKADRLFTTHINCHVADDTIGVRVKDEVAWTRGVNVGTQAAAEACHRSSGTSAPVQAVQIVRAPAKGCPVQPGDERGAVGILQEGAAGIFIGLYYTVKFSVLNAGRAAPVPEAEAESASPRRSTYQQSSPLHVTCGRL